MTKPSKQPKESTAAEWNMITAKAEVEKLESEMNSKKVETKSVSDTPEINQNRTADLNVAITIPELISSIPHRLEDSSPDDQEYRELKTVFVEEVNEWNEKYAAFNEARKRLKTKNSSTPSAAKKSVYGAPIQSNSLSSIVKLAQKQISKNTTSLVDKQGDEGDQYTSFRDELCNDNCKSDCKCKMQSRIAIK